MYDPAPEPRGPLTPGERWIVVGFSTFLLGAFAADVATDFAPAKLSILFVLLAWPPLLVLHEAGHAVVAGAFGWRIDGVVLGFGRPVADFRLAGIDVQLRTLPVEGFVRCEPVSAEGVRWRSAAVYFAGPGVELLLAVAILLLVGPELLAASESPAFIAVQSVALAATLGAVLNLIPHSSLNAAGEVPNDGLGILQSLLRSQAQWEAELRARTFFRASEDRDKS